MVIYGDGTDIEFLKSENIQDVDSFIAVTENEKTNLIAGLLAKHLGAKQSIIHVSTTEYIPTIQEIGIGAVISKNLSTVNSILKELHTDMTEIPVVTFDEIDVDVIEFQSHYKAQDTFLGMRIKTLLNILGALLSILGITMVVPIFISLGYGEPDWEGFLISSIICVIVGFPTWFITRHNQSLTNRDGFAIVTFSWVLAGIAGSFPFYFSGAIPNVTDAFFESMSGVTTTGASITACFIGGLLFNGLAAWELLCFILRSCLCWAWVVSSYLRRRFPDQ